VAGKSFHFLFNLWTIISRSLESLPYEEAIVHRGVGGWLVRGDYWVIISLSNFTDYR
jgi:hypothetical protein